jgi:hypothetical protein
MADAAAREAAIKAADRMRFSGKVRDSREFRDLRDMREMRDVREVREVPQSQPKATGGFWDWLKAAF